jgi:hypothetical protein
MKHLRTLLKIVHYKFVNAVSRGLLSYLVD